MRRSVVAVLFLLVAAAPSVAQRLPGDAYPLHYQLTLAPDLAAERFSGEETIDLRIDKPTSRITLHALGLEIDEAVVTRSTGVDTAASPSFEPASEFLVLTLPTRLPAGVCKLRLKFHGPLTNSMVGLYLSRANGRKYAATQFESVDARRAFPCFDEPALKASFAVSAIVDAGDMAISNGRLLSDTPGPVDGKHTLRFTTTPKMSTYLVALAVGDFACSEGAVDNIPIRACATPDKKELTHFAVDAAENALRYFNTYFSIRYPFRKLDLVAIPDFSAGAMENTAAIFFREPDMLLDEGTATPQRQADVAGVIAHEISHQWFGDLVTFTWWDDLWLNEGFATWMESKPLIGWKPQWHADLDAIRRGSQAMNVDATRVTRPVRARVATRNEIDESFDAIAYDKAGAVLRMVEASVGPEVFRAAVNAYLRAHVYGTATSEDFWSVLATTSRTPADRILKSFVDQAGVPLLTVTSRCPSETETSLSATQQRLTLTGPTTGTWVFPVEVRPLSAANTVPTPLLMESPQQALTLGGCAPLLADVGGRGYFRTAYDAEALTRLAGLASLLLTPPERLRLVADEWALVRSGIHDITAFLRIAEALSGERQPAVLQELADHLNFTHDVLVPATARDSFEAWTRRVFKPRMQELGWASAATEDDDRTLAREVIVSLLATAGRDAEAIAAARTTALQVAASAGTGNRLRASAAVLQAAAATGGPDVVTALLGALGKGGSTDVQAAIREAIGAATDPDQVTRVLTTALSDRVRAQDALDLAVTLVANPIANRTAWGFVTEHWADLSAKLGGQAASTKLIEATGSFCEAGSRDGVARFFSGKIDPASRTLLQALEQIDNCRDLKLREGERLATFVR